VTASPPEGVFIPTGQMYAQLQTLESTVNRVESKLDQLAQQQAQITDHESRLRDLESRRFPHSTVSVVSAGIAAMATAVTVWQASGR
jgi:hypothetical protein